MLGDEFEAIVLTPVDDLRVRQRLCVISFIWLMKVWLQEPISQHAFSEGDALCQHYSLLVISHK